MSGQTRCPWTAVALTLFPGVFPGPLGASLAGQGLAEGLWQIECVDIRSFATGAHASVDDAPFGGGPGMVMRADVVDAAVRAVTERHPDLPLIYLTPRGERLDQTAVRALAAGPGCVLLCGRYEGIDERVLAAHRPRELSLGDFVLSGGEPAAIALLDACVRLLPGVLGSPASLSEESFERDLLEYPQFTRPRLWEGHEVPDVLLSGHHGQIAAWRRTEAERITRERRPDLWRRYAAAGSPAKSTPARQPYDSEGGLQ